MSDLTSYSTYTNISSDPYTQGCEVGSDIPPGLLQTHSSLSSLLLRVFGPGGCTPGFLSEPFPSPTFSAPHRYLLQVTAFSPFHPGLGW